MPDNSDSKNNPERANPSRPARSGRRIAKVMARAGLASRREAEAWIVAGRVAVNGKAIASPALNVGAKDSITVDGKPLPQHERTRLFLYHKPRGLVTTTSDPEGRPTVFGALPKHLPRLVTIGRLDFTTEGLLLLTNDGGLARVLEHPQTGWLRRYRVRAHGNITQPQLDALRDGITVDGIHYGPIEASVDRTQGANVWLTFAIREGKNREVRNVLNHLGLAVNRLIRVSFGPFQLAELAEGAVEEVRTRVLRDQLGKKIASLADADFDGPLLTPNDPAAVQHSAPTGHPGARTRSGPRRPEPRAAEGRQPRQEHGGGRERSSFPHPRKAGRDRDRTPQDGGNRFGHPPRLEEAEKPSKARPWRGRGRERPIAEPAPDGEAPRKTKAGLLTDRKGRRILVERVQSEPPAPAPERKPTPARFGKDRKPSRDRRHGPRPSRPASPGGGKDK